MGWWRLEQGGNLRRSASSGGGGSSSISSGECLVRASPNSNRPSAPEGIIGVDGGVTALGAGVSAKMAGQDNAAGEGYAAASSGAGGTTPPADEDDQRDEYGSWDGFADDADLDALLSGRSTTPAGNQSGDMAAAVALSEAEASAASAAAAAATVAAAAKKKTQEEQELWQSLARGAQTHVLPHLHDILKRSYTIVRFAQGPSSSCRRITSATASGAPRSMSTGARGSSTLAEAPPDATLGKSTAGAPWAALPGDSEVDARLALELHAIAAFVSLRGSLGGNGVGDGSNHGSNRRDGKAGSFGYHTVRDKYLDVHRMTGNPLTPQQRLLAPAFFCIALGLHRVVGRGSGDAMYARRGEATPEGRSLCVEGCPPSRPASLLAEALRGKEWDMLQLWVQVALDPLAFPSPRRSNDRHPRRRSSRQGRAGNGSGRGSSEPSDVVRKRFEGFTRCLSAAFAPGVTAGCGSDGGGDKGGGSGGRGGRGWQQAQTIDKDVVGVFEKRLSRFEPAQLASLSSNESKVLERVLDLQSVIAHCGGLWAAALVITGPTHLPEVDRKRIKERVVKLTHNCIKSLKRFIPEVFPREQETERDIRLRAGPARGGNDEKEAVSPPRYGSAFRRLYGHAVYSVAAFLLRMCGGALKGSPLRELVGTFFEGIAFHPVSGGRGGGGGGKGGRGAVGGSGGTVPHAQLTDFAVMHLPDLLQCFSEMPMIVPPVAEWIKNVNDHAIHGDAPSSSAPASPSVAGAALAPLLFSLSSGLRGDLNYTCRPPLTPSSGNASPSVTVDLFCDLVAHAALAPPPRPDPTALPKRMARMRLEVLGDRKLRAARFVMEAAVARGRPAEEGAAAGPRRVPVNTTRRILALLTAVFRLQGPPPSRNISGASTGAGGGATGTAGAMVARVGSAAVLTQPPLNMLRDVLPLLRPVYSLLGEALLGEPGPARRLGRHALATAGALSIAGLELTPAAKEAASAEVVRPESWRQGALGGAGAAEGEVGPTTERRLAECFADVVVLAVSTKLDTFLAAVGDDVGTDGGGVGDGGGGQHGGGGDIGNGLAALDDLGPRESELEALISELGAWESHGGGRGWPHHSLGPAEDPPAVEAPLVGEGRAGSDDGGTPLSALLQEAEEIGEAFQSVTTRQRDRALLRRVRGTLVPRIEACRRSLSEGRRCPTV